VETFMLRFTSFFPMASFLKIELEFGDETINHKFKSLEEEGQIEIPYSKIAHIQFSNRADTRWLTIGFIFAITDAILVAALFNFFPQICGNLNVYWVGRMIFLLGITLCLAGFIKRDFCSFLDKDHEYLAGIAITNKNLDDVYEAIEFVKAKTTIISETYPDLLDQNKNPKFELITYRLPNYFYKNTTLFYDDKILDVEKSLVIELTSEYKYNDLMPKITISKHGDTSWNTVALYIVAIGVLSSASLDLFFPSTQIGLMSIWISIGFSIIPILLSYIKNEIVFFYDKNDHVAFNINIPRGKKQSVEEIIQFVKAKFSETSGA